MNAVKFDKKTGRERTVRRYHMGRKQASLLTREGKKACAMVSFSTLSLREKVPWAPAGRKQFCTFSWPRLATITLGDRELSGMRITGAPASISSRTLDARWGWSRTCTETGERGQSEEGQNLVEVRKGTRYSFMQEKRKIQLRNKLSRKHFRNIILILKTR